MSKELIERLRKSASIGVSLPDPAIEAADRIEELEMHLAKSNESLGDEMTKNAALQADNERLREALEGAFKAGAENGGSK